MGYGIKRHLRGYIKMDNSCFEKNKLSCSLKYVFIICFLTGVRFTIWEKLCLDYLDSDLFGITVQILLFAVIELIIIQITSAFAYMLVHNKMKFKRFFSFWHFKYFKFNLIVLFTYALFWGGCTFVVNDLRFSHSFSRQGRFMFYFIAAFLLVLNAFKMIFSYFRAEKPNESFRNITKRFFGFVCRNIKSISSFFIKLFPWMIGYVFLIVFFNQTDFELTVYVMLNSCMYGLGVFFFPCYILGFNRLVRSVGEG